MNEIIWCWPYIVVLILIGAIIIYLRSLIIADTIKRVYIGDIYIDPGCNKINSEYLGKWMEYKVIKKTNNKIICEHYWRDAGNSKRIIEPISSIVSFTHKEFFYKFKRYDI